MGNPVVQWQIVTREPARVEEFFTKVFGWAIDANNALGYRMVKTGGFDGGIWPSPPEGQNLVQLFVKVEDIDAALAAITAAGGSIVFPKQQLPDGDSMAIAIDPTGMPFGLMG
jgi:predicted enzyme related to lactoylglutathione lyase